MFYHKVVVTPLLEARIKLSVVFVASRFERFVKMYHILKTSKARHLKLAEINQFCGRATSRKQEKLVVWSGQKTTSSRMFDDVWKSHSHFHPRTWASGQYLLRTTIVSFHWILWLQSIDSWSELLAHLDFSTNTNKLLRERNNLLHRYRCESTWFVELRE